MVNSTRDIKASTSLSSALTFAQSAHTSNKANRKLAAPPANKKLERPQNRKSILMISASGIRPGNVNDLSKGKLIFVLEGEWAIILVIFAVGHWANTYTTTKGPSQRKRQKSRVSFQMLLPRSFVDHLNLALLWVPVSLQQRKLQR